jgi:hypothetical protein
MSGLFDQITNYSPPLLTAGQVNYKGTWDASANTPTLVSPPAATSKGDYYVVSVAGTQFSITFAVGDWIISNGTAWEKVDLTDAVSSVFGRTGAVVGASTDYSSVGLTNTAIGASSPSTGAFTTVTASSTIAATGAVTGSNLSGTNTGDQTITLTGGVTGSGTGSFAATVVTNANLTGDVTSVGNATTLTNAPVIAKVLTGYVSGAGTVAATDSILQAIQKLNGNDATNANLTGAITSVGNATSLGSFSSANLSAALTDETGSGAAVFATSPTLVTPILGTPSSGTLSSCTGLPISTGVSGLGTGIATALAINTGSAGAPVLFNGALGTPTSGTVTNLTGTASININGTVGATTPSTGRFTTVRLDNADVLTWGGAYGAGIPSILGSTGAGELQFRPTGSTNGTIATLSSTGLAVTGALSSTTGANFATSSGSVGVGTASPTSQLSVVTTTNNLLSLTKTATVALNVTAASSPTGIDISANGGNVLTFNTGSNNGNVGIGTTSPAVKLHVSASTNQTSQFISSGNYSFLRIGHTGTGAANWDFYTGVGGGSSTFGIANSGGTRLAINSAGSIQFNAYGAGALTTDASGNITAASDERIKSNIRPFSRGLAEILAINPILHGYTEESGLDQSRDDYAGFSAQQVQPLIPEAIGKNANGMLSFSDRPVMAALVNAMKELNANLVAELQSVRQRLAALEA